MTKEDEIVLPPTFWLTRDRINGELSIRVDVWSVRPERTQYEDGGVIWGTEDDRVCHVTFWRYPEAVKRIGPGVPATDRECTCVGREIAVPKVVVS